MNSCPVTEVELSAPDAPVRMTRLGIKRFQDHAAVCIFALLLSSGPAGSRQRGVQIPGLEDLGAHSSWLPVCIPFQPSRGKQRWSRTAVEG